MLLKRQQEPTGKVEWRLQKALVKHKPAGSIHPLWQKRERETNTDYNWWSHEASVESRIMMVQNCWFSLIPSHLALFLMETFTVCLCSLINMTHPASICSRIRLERNNLINSLTKELSGPSAYTLHHHRHPPSPDKLGPSSAPCTSPDRWNNNGHTSLPPKSPIT